MNSSKTQVNKKLKSMNRKINNLNKRLTSNAPVAISTKKGSTGKDYYRTTGRERISNVTALNQSFNITDIFINPANQSLFPWLSGIGKKYDLYHFKRLRFSYVPALPTSEEGNVYLGLDYNTLDPSPSSSNELCQLSHWTMNVVWKPNNLVIDLNNIGWLYTRTGPVANADYKTYDLGRLFVAVEGITYGGTVGYIEVDYDVEFKRRQPDYAQGAIPTTDIFEPLAYIKIASLGPTTLSSTFSNSSLTNNAIIELNDSSGYFTVSRSCKAIFHTIAVFGDGITYAACWLHQSSDNVTYTSLSSANNLVSLSPGIYYKLYNNSTAATDIRCQVSIISID